MGGGGREGGDGPRVLGGGVGGAGGAEHQQKEPGVVDDQEQAGLALGGAPADEIAPGAAVQAAPKPSPPSRTPWPMVR